MLPISIYSAALACLAKEQEKPPPTWPGFGQADFWKVEVKQILQVLLHLSTLGNTPHIQIYLEYLKKHPELDNYNWMGNDVHDQSTNISGTKINCN